jgi:hypothetical protein
VSSCPPRWICPLGVHAPAVVALHGAQAGRRSFLLYEHLAALLPAAGIGVLRYDRRSAKDGDDVPLAVRAADVRGSAGATSADRWRSDRAVGVQPGRLGRDGHGEHQARRCGIPGAGCLRAESLQRTRCALAQRNSSGGTGSTRPPSPSLSACAPPSRSTYGATSLAPQRKPQSTTPPSGHGFRWRMFAGSYPTDQAPGRTCTSTRHPRSRDCPARWGVTAYGPYSPRSRSGTMECSQRSSRAW